MNKKLLNLILLVLPVAACTPEGDNTPEPVAPFTLTVDKNVIESDGLQTATFKVIDANGEVITDYPSLARKVRIKNETTDTRLPLRIFTFRSIDDGEYTFSATCTGETCENTVTVESKNRSNYEVFKKNVCIYRFTATWCEYCPSMTTGYEKVDDWTKGRIVEMAIHDKDSWYAMGEGTESGSIATGLLMRFYGTIAYPSCVYDLDEKSEVRAYSDIEAQVFDRLAHNPATCGIKANCSYVGETLTINAAVKTSTGGRYDLGYALLKDNLPGGGGAKEDEYDNVVLALSGNYQYMSNKAAQVEKNAEKEFAHEMNELRIPATDNLDEYSVVVFALKEVGNKVIIDNVVKMPLVNGSVDYVLN